MLDVQPARMRDMLEQLEQATRDHAEWYANLLRVIVCELPCDPNDVAPGAHHHCPFGRWYYKWAAAELRDLPAYERIGEQHLHVHNVAERILRAATSGWAVDRVDFDELAAGSARLRRELDVLRNDLLSALRFRDPLTGALDRTRVLPELRECRTRGQAGAQSCCLAFMDVDRLQEINANQGHQAGDALLVAAVRFLATQLRPADKVFRYGGDEFLILLPDADLEAGRAIVGRVRERLAARPLADAPLEVACSVTASFGLAVLDPEVRIEDSIDRAAQALLLAKAAGGNRVIAWDPSVTTGRQLRRLQVREDPA
jgi:diguanylate cyclase